MQAWLQCDAWRLRLLGSCKWRPPHSPQLPHRAHPASVAGLLDPFPPYLEPRTLNPSPPTLRPLTLSSWYTPHAIAIAQIHSRMGDRRTTSRNLRASAAHARSRLLGPAPCTHRGHARAHCLSGRLHAKRRLATRQLPRPPHVASSGSQRRLLWCACHCDSKKFGSLKGDVDAANCLWTAARAAAG